MSLPLILMYHRVADEPVDYWGLAVSQAHFEEHLEVLCHARRPLPLEDFVRRVTDDTLPPDAVAVTFDDGYVDNLTAAKPRLVAAGVAATVFLATGFLDRAAPFWWDELARLTLVEDGPPSAFDVAIGGEAMHFDLRSEATLRADGSTPLAAVPTRQAALEKMHQKLRCIDEPQREAAMSELRSIFGGYSAGAGLGRPMSSGEVRELIADGLIAIGSHTVTHPALMELDATTCLSELSTSRRACEVLAGISVRAFAIRLANSTRQPAKLSRRPASRSPAAVNAGRSADRRTFWRCRAFTSLTSLAMPSKSGSITGRRRRHEAWPLNPAF
jgi:peptidoglycan/xylan/chitin deacetylase (PgdA/CDA1 family)